MRPPDASASDGFGWQTCKEQEVVLREVNGTRTGVLIIKVGRVDGVGPVESGYDSTAIPDLIWKDVVQK